MPKSKIAKASAKSKKAQPSRAAKKPAKAAKAGAKPAAKAKPTKAAKPTKPAAKAKPAPKAAKVNGKKPAPSAKSEPVKNDRPIKPLVAPAKSKNSVKLSPFLEKQKDRLLQLRDSLLDSMSGVAKDTLRARAEGSEASAFGMHQADAGSDAYDRDFALSLLSQEQDALYEIEEALKRLEAGTYGVCEMSGKPIAHARLEALPFARYTVECQAQFEKQRKIAKSRAPVTSLFGLTDDESDDAEDEESTPTESKEEKE
jgi:RNA polymerase-binding transcription factor DksA